MKEGSESEIKMANYIVAVVREYEPQRGALVWKAQEISVTDTQLFL